MDTLVLKVLFGYLGPVCTFGIPWTFKYLLDTLDFDLSLENLGQFVRLLEVLPTVALYHGEVQQGNQGGKLSSSCMKWNFFGHPKPLDTFCKT